MGKKRRNKKAVSVSPVKAPQIVSPAKPSEPTWFGMNFEQMVSQMAQAQMATAHIPAMAAEHVRKAWRQMERLHADRGPKAMFIDPFDTQMAMGWRERRTGIGYEMLKEVERQLAVVRAIVNVRCAQVSAFSEPYDETNNLGCMIVPKDRTRSFSKAAMKRARDILRFMLGCGQPKQNPESHVRRDRFDVFLRKLVRDSLIFDSAAVEIVPDENGQPYEFYAVDGTTIRFAPALGDVPGMGSGSIAGRVAAFYDDERYNPVASDGRPAKFLQVINNQITSSFSDREMLYGVRNPRSDIYSSAYGYSELEQAISIITTLIDTEKYQANIFRNGTMPRGILNMKGTEWTPEQMENLKRMWSQQLQGQGNSHRMPIVQFDGDLQFINMQHSNKDMEFSRYHEFLVAVLCGVYLCDPEEIALSSMRDGQQSPIFSGSSASSEAKLKASRDRGLKPLLRFIASMMQQIVDQIDDSFQFRFVGLDEPSELEKHQRRLEELASVKTLNEVRSAMGLPPYQDERVGNMIMSPTLLQAHKLVMEQDMAQGGAAPQQTRPEPPAQGGQA
jgi:hypothetical protein